MFGHTSKNLGKFLRGYAKILQLGYEKYTGDHIIHALVTNGPNELQECIYWVHRMCKELFMLK